MFNTDATAPDQVNRSTRHRIRAAACRLFFEKGYDMTSQREVAALVGIKAGSLYNHFPSKQDLLFDIMMTFVTDLLRTVEDRIEGQRDPVGKLQAAGSAHVLIHTQRREEGAIWNSEIRSLEPDRRARFIAMRDRYQAVIEGIIREGVETGVFRTRDIRLATYAVVNLWNSVAEWYREDGRLRLGKVADIYVDLALALLRADQTSEV